MRTHLVGKKHHAVLTAGFGGFGTGEEVTVSRIDDRGWLVAAEQDAMELYIEDKYSEEMLRLCKFRKGEEFHCRHRETKTGTEA